MQYDSKLVIQPSSIVSVVAAIIYIIFTESLPGAQANDIWMLARENACFSSTYFVTNSTFNAPYPGNVTAVQLRHVSGSVTCTNGSGTNWGCYAAVGDRFDVEMIRLDDDGSESTVLPTETTEDIYNIDYLSCSNGHGCSVLRYFSNEYSLDSDVLTWRDPESILTVSVDDTFSLQHSEGCCNYSTGDNAGVSCADVYFQYDHLDTAESITGIGCLL